ncbi:MAG: dipeptidase PepE [Opitutaceae bacterium]
MDRRTFINHVTLLGTAALVSRPMDSFAAENAGRERLNGLLISATTNPGQGFLEHAAAILRETYAGCATVTLLPYASAPGGRDFYEKRMNDAFVRLEIAPRVVSLHHHEGADAGRALKDAEAVFVSGGQTFLLLRSLYDLELVDLLRERAFAGMPYAGASAGSNVAGALIGTTNDFPVTDIPTRRSLGLLPHLINPHHPVEGEPEFEGRRGKILWYQETNPSEIVIGLPNPSMLRLKGSAITLMGGPAFRYERPDVTRLEAGAEIS